MRLSIFAKNKTSDEQNIPRPMFLSLTTQDQILFAKRLAILLKGGVPLLEALVMLRQQSSGKAMAFVLASIIAGVEQGQSLAASLEKLQLFGDFAVHIIYIGESSGTLHDNLHYLAQELKKSEQLKKKVISALIYPLFIVVATIAITSLLTLYIFPKILPVFQSFHFTLPWTTRMLIALSRFLTEYFVFIFLGFLAVVFGIIYLFRLPRFRLLFDKGLLKIPLLGTIFQSYNLANFSRTFGLLLQSNVRIVDAAAITAKTASNAAYREQFAKIGPWVTKGEKISVFLIAAPSLFPPLLCQMLSVGETTGRLSESFLYVAEIYETEVDDLTKNLSSLIEPVLMIGMGLVVGFVAISIITPIYQITQNLHP